MHFCFLAVIQLSIFALEGLTSPDSRHKHVVQDVGIVSSTSSSLTSKSSSSSIRITVTSILKSTSVTLKSTASTSESTIPSLKSTSLSSKSSSLSSKTASLSFQPTTSTAKSTTLTLKSSSSTVQTSIVVPLIKSISSSTSALLINLTPTSPANSGKRGIPYNSPATNIQHFNASGSKVTWAFNWDSLMDTDFPSYLEFVPMLWGNSSVHTTNWKKNVQNALSRGSKAVLAFNEPDACGGGQSCLTPQAAANAYLTYVQPFAGQVKLGGPAVTEVGTAWLLEFLALCANCTIDFIPMHIYNSATNIAYYQAHMKDIANQTGWPIWLTEFSATGNQTVFLQTLMPWMDAQPFIQRYAWFMCSPGYSGSTCGADGYPTALGQVYELF